MNLAKLGIGMDAPDFSYIDPWDGEQTLHGQLGERGVVLFFLRYAGCPLCQYKVVELRRDYQRFADKGYHVLVAFQSMPETVEKGFTKADVPMGVVCDVRSQAFDLYGVQAGGVMGYIAPPVVAKTVKATMKGFKRGTKTGCEKELQLPAVFIIPKEGYIRWLYYGRHIDDLPPNDLLVARL